MLDVGHVHFDAELRERFLEQLRTTGEVAIKRAVLFRRQRIKQIEGRQGVIARMRQRCGRRRLNLGLACRQFALRRGRRLAGDSSCRWCLDRQRRIRRRCDCGRFFGGFWFRGDVLDEWQRRLAGRLFIVLHGLFEPAATLGNVALFLFYLPLLIAPRRARGRPLAPQKLAAGGSLLRQRHGMKFEHQKKTDQQQRHRRHNRTNRAQPTDQPLHR